MLTWDSQRGLCVVLTEAGRLRVVRPRSPRKMQDLTE